jgi:glycosyltransferase involved in cell wall biosynthesis
MTYRGATVGVVVPCYHEEGFVGDVIESVPAFVDRVYVVDDASTDGTWGEITAAAARTNRRTPTDPDATDFDRRVVTVRRAENGGVGAAITTGYEYARRDGIDVVAVMNGDGQMDPDHLGRIVDPVVSGEAEYAKGNRLVHREHREAMSGWRLFGNALLSGLTKVASGYWQLTDPQNGYTAIDGETLAALDLDALYEDYGFCNHLLVTLHRHGARVADVALPAVYGDERSHIRYRTFVPKLSALLARSFLGRLRAEYVVNGFHPLVLFYVLAALAGLAGVAGLGGAALVVQSAPARAGSLALVATLALLLCGFGTAAAMTLDVRAAGGLERHYYDGPDDDAPRATPRARANGRLRHATAEDAAETERQ